MENKMLSARSETILKSIIDWYIEHAVPVSSQNLVHDYDLGVSSATVRNEMADLEGKGYIIRPHTSAGSIPSDKGYRFYVASLDELSLPISEQRTISHLFHQVEGKMDEWLSLAASVIARISQNTAVITAPKTVESQFRHMELVSIQDCLVLLVLVLKGARIKQQLLTFETPISQSELTRISSQLNLAYEGLTVFEIKNKSKAAVYPEKLIIESLVNIIQAEETQEYNQSYLEGLHFMLNQPEFSHNQKIMTIMELLEHRNMLSTILPQEQANEKIRVIIGSENKAELAQECSLVISHYGLADQASGMIVVVGPTRMDYPRIISAVNYLSLLLSGMVGELYGINVFDKKKQDNTN
jgi:heat-inducible transcriptional repressor